MRTDIINRLIRERGYTRYAEIGVMYGVNLDAVVCDIKHGVDPAAKVAVTHPVTSDEFFETAGAYDIIFIDGLHTEEQAYLDAMNALAHITEGGVVVMHDCDPPSEHAQSYEDNGGLWCGTVWKALARLRTIPELSIRTIDDDLGVAIVEFGQQEPISVPRDPTWTWFVENRALLLNFWSCDGRFAVWNSR